MKERTQGDGLSLGWDIFSIFFRFFFLKDVFFKNNKMQKKIKLENNFFVFFNVFFFKKKFEKNLSKKIKNKNSKKKSNYVITPCPTTMINRSFVLFPDFSSSYDLCMSFIIIVIVGPLWSLVGTSGPLWCFKT